MAKADGRNEVDVVVGDDDDVSFFKRGTNVAS